MASTWFIECEKEDGIVPLSDYLTRKHEQLDYLKISMDIAEVAKVLVDHSIYHGNISLNTVSVRGGSVVVCGLNKTKKATDRSLKSDLYDLAVVANQVSAKINNEYRPHAKGTRDSFVKFGERALSLFKAY